MKFLLIYWHFCCLFITFVTSYIHQEDYQEVKKVFNQLSPVSLESQKDVLHKTVQKLLDFKEPPSNDNVNRNLNNPATEYMRNLFEDYNNRNFEAEENIVRSVIPVVGTFNGANALIFKLNAIHKNEQILKAELHFNQRHKTRAEKYRHVKKGVVAQVACPSCSQTTKEAAARQYVTLPVERLSSKDKHWVVFDCRDLTDDSLQTNLSSLMVHFYRNGHLLNAESVLRKNTPFLLVYTASKLSVKSDIAEDVDDENESVEEDDDDDNDSDSSQQINNNRVKRSVSSYYSYNHDMGNDNKEIKFVEGETPMYRSRGIHLQQQMDEFVRSGPKALTPRKHRNRKRKIHRKKTKFNDPMMGFGQVDDSEEGKEKKDINKTNNPLSMLLLGKNVKQFSKNQPCSRRKFSVSFRDVGWHDVVIQPSYFDAYYCAGSCEYPMNLVTNPSNHALIQSLVNKMSIYPNIPKVCCAPDKMDSLTMLFFDETGNVVLKNFPRMVVSSCSCL